MGRNYDDELEFILDGEAESVSNGRCTNLTPSDRLRALWDKWRETVRWSLDFWGRGHAKEAQIADLVQNELYAFDVYATLSGMGVGIWDGRWDAYMDDDRPGAKNLLKNLEMHLERWLKKDYAKLHAAIEDEAMSQCDDFDDDDDANGGSSGAHMNGLEETVAINIDKIKTKAQAAAALRKLGYAKSYMQMTRNATSYTLGGNAPHAGTLMITLGHGHFLVTGNKRWNFGSMMMMVGNLREGAEARLQELLVRLTEMGVLQVGQEITPLQLAVAIAVGEHMERSGAVN